MAEDRKQTGEAVDDPQVLDAEQRRGTRAWHDSLTEAFKRLTEDSAALAAIEKRSF
jgi:hypothetical protein